MVQWVEDIPEHWLSVCSVKRLPWHITQAGKTRRWLQLNTQAKSHLGKIVSKVTFHESPFQKKTRSRHPGTKSLVINGSGQWS